VREHAAAEAQALPCGSAYHALCVRQRGLLQQQVLRLAFEQAVNGKVLLHVCGQHHVNDKLAQQLLSQYSV
jgi:hypothetical protein